MPKFHPVDDTKTKTTYVINVDQVSRYCDGSDGGIKVWMSDGGVLELGPDSLPSWEQAMQES